MQKMKLSLFSISVVIFCLFCKQCTSSSNLTLDIADFLFELQKYDEAITEYKRFNYFQSDEKVISYSFFKMGLAYRALGKLDEAVKCLEQSAQLTNDDYIRNDRKIILASTLIVSKQYDTALLELIEVSNFAEDKEQQLKALYFQGLAHLFKYDWGKAAESFGEFYSKFGEEDKTFDEEKRRINKILMDSKHLSYKSVRTAKLLSTIIPGSGQIYAGNLKQGINAMLLNILTLNILIQKGSWNINSSLTFFSLFERYYSGNKRQSQETVKSYNKQINDTQLKKILKEISKYKRY